jgi:hypothetical protein
MIIPITNGPVHGMRVCVRLSVFMYVFFVCMYVYYVWSVCMICMWYVCIYGCMMYMMCMMYMVSIIWYDLYDLYVCISCIYVWSVCMVSMYGKYVHVYHTHACNLCMRVCMLVQVRVLACMCILCMFILPIPCSHGYVRLCVYVMYLVA